MKAFAYQSVCHCSKTYAMYVIGEVGLTTSQFVTAPKPVTVLYDEIRRLTTSQFVTAPKLAL